MANIPGINIPAAIAPYTTEDSFPTHDAVYGKGGQREVLNLIERDAIPAARRTQGMSVYVISEELTYRLKNGTSNSDWVVDSSSLPVLTDTQVAYGSPSNLMTSSGGLTFASNTDTLYVGYAGDGGYVSANTGESLTINGDLSIKFSSGNTDWIVLNDDGSLSVNNSVGTIGQVLTSSGPGVPPVWSGGIFELSSFAPGIPDASQVMIRYAFARTVVFPVGLLGSLGNAGVAATAQTDFDFQKNGSSLGTMRFAPSATSATFVGFGVSTITFNAGDKLTVIAPGSPDATLADVFFTLAGTR